MAESIGLVDTFQLLPDKKYDFRRLYTVKGSSEYHWHFSNCVQRFIRCEFDISIIRSSRIEERPQHLVALREMRPSPLLLDQDLLSHRARLRIKPHGGTLKTSGDSALLISLLEETNNNNEEKSSLRHR